MCAESTNTDRFVAGRQVFLLLQVCVTSRTGLSFIALLSNTVK